MHAQTGGAPVYRYSFDRKIPVAPDAEGQRRRRRRRKTSARGTPARSSTSSARSTPCRSVTWEPSDRKLSDAMVTYWSNFARTGDPNGAGLPSGRATTQRRGRVLHLDETIRAAPDPLRPRYEAIDAYVKKAREQ